MRISDWSSDVCSSDLLAVPVGTRMARVRVAHPLPLPRPRDEELAGRVRRVPVAPPESVAPQGVAAGTHGGRSQLGSASCRERVCKYVSIWVVAGSLNKKNTTASLYQ